MLAHAEAVHDYHADDDDDHHHQGDGGPQLGIVGPAQELLLNQVPQQKLRAAAQHFADGEGGDRGDKNHGDAGEDPRKGEGQNDPAEDVEPVRPKVPGGPMREPSSLTMTE